MWGNGRPGAPHRVFDQHRQVHTEVGDVGEWPARIEGQRSEGREDLALEMAPQQPLLLALQLVVGEYGQIGFAQGLAQIGLPAVHLRGQFRKQLPTDGRQLF